MACLWLLGCHQGPTAGSVGTGGGGGGGTNGTLVLFAEDQPAGNVLAFELTISSVTLTPSGGGSTVTVLSSADAVALEWRSRALGPNLLKAASVPAGTYTSITVTVSSPRITVFNPLTSTFTQRTPATCSGASLMLSLPLNLAINAGEVVGLRLDLDLRNSILLDSMNNLCLNPNFDPVPTSFVPGLVPGDIDDVVGSVSSVSGSQLGFTVLASGEPITVVTDAATLFEGITGLSSLQVGNNIELDARLQTNGNFLGQEIERETAATNQQLRGLVLERTPATGTLTSLNLLVQDAVPTPPATQEPGEIFTVTVDANTVFRISTEDLPQAAFPNLDFDPDSLGVGQFIHVVERSGAAGFTADAVALEEIALVGQVGSSVGVNSFLFVPDGDFFLVNGLGQINVRVTSVTELEDMPAGLSSLQPNQSIVGVRGVLLFQAGSGVLVTKRVRLLQP